MRQDEQQSLWWKTAGSVESDLFCDAASGPRVSPYPLFQTQYRKWAHRKGRSSTGGFDGPIEGLPELIATCNGKESVLAAILGQELKSSQIAQVR